MSLGSVQSSCVKHQTKKSLSFLSFLSFSFNSKCTIVRSCDRVNGDHNIEIPDIVIAINPVVLQIIGKCLEAGRKPRVDDFTTLVKDTNFLNSLQADVNGWIREIKKVTKLDRDPSSGTALQEISFWPSLERALNCILKKRESLEVTPIHHHSQLRL